MLSSSYNPLILEKKVVCEDPQGKRYVLSVSFTQLMLHSYIYAPLQLHSKMLPIFLSFNPAHSTRFSRHEQWSGTHWGVR